MAPLKSNTGGGNHTHNLRRKEGRANHTHNLRKRAGGGNNTQKLLKPYVPKRKQPKAEAAEKGPKFLELPREIRDMIFDLAMCVDGVLVPYAVKDDLHYLDNGGPPPSLALLRVNKQIREQARMCMLRVNTWRITEPWPLRPGVLWQINPLHITHVVLSYFLWDGSPSRAEELEKLNDIHSNPRYFDVNLRRDALRRWKMDLMRDSWRARKGVVSRFGNLKVLTIDTTNLMCPSGCCRLEMMRQLFCFSNLELAKQNVDVRVLGVRDEANGTLSIHGAISAWPS